MPTPPRSESAGDDLEAANEVFHDEYDRIRATEELVGIVWVVLADDLIVYEPDGGRRTVRVTPSVFHAIKSVAHVPVGLFASLARAFDANGLRSMNERIERSIGSLSGAGGDLEEDTRALMRETLEQSKRFAERCLASPEGPAETELAEFARASGERLVRLTEHATRVQLDALHLAVENELRLLEPGDRQHLQVVVTGAHQARARSLGMQYFRKRFGEPEGAEDRVAYAEGVEDPDEALALVGTRRVDAAIALAFFGDPKRLQRDVLGDAVRDLLSRTDLDPIR